MSKSTRKLAHNGTEYNIVGRRRLPCGHHRYRPSDDDFHGFDRICDTCHRSFVGALEHSDMLTEKCGHPTATIVWDDDPVTIKLADAKEAPTRIVKKKRVGNGGRTAPRTPSTDDPQSQPQSKPRSRITRVGPTR